MNTKNRMNVIFCPFWGNTSEESYGNALSHIHTNTQMLLAAWIDMSFNQNEQSYVMWQLNAYFSL